jgi:3-oxoacyl-[acyl-carrier-protein] synthase-1
MSAQVVAVAARTPVGLRAESSAAAVRAGISRVAGHPTMLDGSGSPLRAAREPSLDPGLAGPARLAALAVAALGELLEKLAAQRPLPKVVSVLLALPEARPGFGPRAGQEVTRSIASAPLPGAIGLDLEVVGAGHAGALKAVEIACKRLAQRQAELCLVGGIDSYLDADTLDWLDTEGRLAQEGRRGGFTPGEGVGFLALATRAARSALGLPMLAQVRGVASGVEPRSPDSAEGLLGDGLTDVVRRATAGLRAPQELIDDTYCDINGERHRTDDWAFTVLRTPNLFRDGTAYVAPVSSWGDVGAAWGALGCVLAVQAWRRRYARGPLALVCGSSDGGQRAAVLLERGES